MQCNQDCFFNTLYQQRPCTKPTPLFRGGGFLDMLKISGFVPRRTHGSTWRVGQLGGLQGCRIATSITSPLSRQRASCTEACRSSCASALLRCPSLPCWFGTPKRRRQLELARKHSHCRPGAAWSPMFCRDCQHMQKYKHQSNLFENPHEGLETEDSV